MARSREEAREAVLENVERIPESGCWIYMGSLNWFGAPNHVKFDVGREAPHRLVMRAEKGDHVCHHCDVPMCLNPHHMYLGTHQTNMDDRLRRGKYGTNKKVAEEQVQFILESPLPSKQIAPLVGISSSRVRAIRLTAGQQRDKRYAKT
jgi:hypothetical protein